MLTSACEHCEACINQRNYDERTKGKVRGSPKLGFIVWGPLIFVPGCHGNPSNTSHDISDKSKNINHLGDQGHKHWPLPEPRILEQKIMAIPSVVVEIFHSRPSYRRGNILRNMKPDSQQMSIPHKTWPALTFDCWIVGVNSAAVQFSCGVKLIRKAVMNISVFFLSFTPEHWSPLPASE